MSYEEPLEVLTYQRIRAMIPDGELRHMYQRMFGDYNEYDCDGKINWESIFYKIAFYQRL